MQAIRRPFRFTIGLQHARKPSLQLDLLSIHTFSPSFDIFLCFYLAIPIIRCTFALG